MATYGQEPTLNASQEDGLRSVLLAEGFLIDNESERMVRFVMRQSAAVGGGVYWVTIDRTRARVTLLGGLPPLNASKSDTIPSDFASFEQQGKDAEVYEWVGPPVPSPDRLRRFLRRFMGRFLS
jgi:hypothetical protein